MFKILFVTDIHDEAESLKELLKLTEAQLYIICGDILYYAFNDIRKVIQFVTLQEEFFELSKHFDLPILPFDLSTEILRSNIHDLKKDYTSKASEYRNLYFEATKTMKEKYEYVLDIIHKYANATTFVLPGNYDIDFKYTALYSRDLHKKILDYENLSFAGYGGAPIQTSGIPDKLAVPYLEGGKGKDFYSEPLDFFEKHQPDILVLHNPAFGFFDRIPSVGHIGSLGIRQYIDDNAPILVLSGHIHEDYGVLINKKGTVFLNTSNFGGVDSLTGFLEGGGFAEIYIQPTNKKVSKIQIRRLYKNYIYDFLELNFIYDSIPRMEYKKLKDFDYFHLDFSRFIRDYDGSFK